MQHMSNEKQLKLHESIRNSDLQEINKLLTENPKLLNLEDDDSRTPLLWALSESSNFEVINAVLNFAKSSKQFDIDHSDGAGYTALHIASARGIEYVDLIWELNPFLEAKTNQGQTALILAVSKQQIPVVEKLIKAGARPGTKDKRQLSALHRASALGNAEIVGLLLNAKAPLNATDDNGWTPLHYAFAEGRTDVIKLLLENGADKNAVDKEEKTPEQVVPLNFKFA